MPRRPSWSPRLALAGLAALPLWLAASTAPAVPGDTAELDRRAAALHRRAAATSPGTPATRLLARDFAELAQTCLEKSENGRAVELLEEACGLDQDNGLALALLTLAYVRADNYAAARFYLSLARERAPAAPPAIYRTLAEVYEALHRLEDAVDAWEEYLRLAGQDPLALSRFSRLKAELTLGSTQRLLQREAFVIFSDAEIPKEIVERAAEELEKAYRAQAEFFQTDLPVSQPVILYAGRAYFALASVPDWVSGVFDGKIRVCLEAAREWSPEVSGVLAHELAHALIRRASRDHAPGWLHEGLAQWWEGRRLTRRDLREIFSRRRPASLPELEGQLAARQSRVAARVHYAEALGLVEFLIAERGEGSISCLVHGLAEGLTPEDALRLETGLSPDELLARWKAWTGL